jgi:hypothetical protein
MVSKEAPRGAGDGSGREGSRLISDVRLTEQYVGDLGGVKPSGFIE